VQHRHDTDSTRGWSTGNKEIVLNNTTVEGDTNATNTGAYGWLGPSITDGFTSNYGSVNNGYWNVNARTYCAWQWKANGGTTSSNTDGQITSTVQANQAAGFSIATFTTDGTDKTVGHGLGAKPDMVIVRSRNVAGSWLVTYDIVDGSVDYMMFNATNTAADLSYGAFTSSTFQYNDNNTNTQVAYSFRSIKGYSKFGTYIGNGQNLGPFVWCGFKPELIIIKNTAAANMWNIYDGQRKRQNSDYVNMFYMNGTNAEYAGTSYHNLDILSNGFKIRLTDASQNGNGNKHIFMAFAKNPFTTSTGVPCTAR